MRDRIRLWVERVRPKSTALAHSVAVRVADGVASAGERLVGIAGTLRPALGPATSTPPPSSPETGPVIEVASTPIPKPVESDPAEPNWQLARAVHQSFAAHLARTTDGVSSLCAGDAQHAERVRVLRVTSRRVRSAVELFSPWLPVKRTRRLLENLRTVTRTLGPVRDLDGLLARFAEVCTDTAADPLRRAASEHVATMLRGELARAQQRATTVLSELDVNRLGADLRVTKRRLVEHLTDEANVHQAVQNVLVPHIEAVFADTPVPEGLHDMEAVHDVRIVAKRLRYACEWVRPMFTHGPGPRRVLKKAQRVVGVARDLYLFETQLYARATELQQQSLPTLAASLLEWQAEVSRLRSRAESRILPALAPLSAANVIRLSCEALDPHARER